jgi:putative hydrolases of HD superfamily
VYNLTIKMEKYSTSQPLKKKDAQRLLEFLHLAENLKNELRHSETSKGRQESVAEHSWRTVLLAVLLKNHLSQGLDWERLLTMIVIHDLAEARTGDVPIFEISLRQQKKQREREAMMEFRSSLPPKTGAWIYELWEEFELKKTNEAKIANALDKLEAQVQHNEANLTSWIDWEKQRVFGGLDSATSVNKPIMRLKKAVVNEAVQKLLKAGEDIKRFRKNIPKAR